MCIAVKDGWAEWVEVTGEVGIQLTEYALSTMEQRHYL